jgi:hypothetical protein
MFSVFDETRRSFGRRVFVRSANSKPMTPLTERKAPLSKARHASRRGGASRRNAMSGKKGRSRALKLRALVEAWAKELEEELELEAGDVEHIVTAMRDALNSRLEAAQAQSA